MARPERLELPTPRFVVWCSIQLSYGRQATTGRNGASGEAAEPTRIAPIWQEPNPAARRRRIGRGAGLRGDLSASGVVRRIAPRLGGSQPPGSASLRASPPSLARGALGTMMSPSHLRLSALAALLALSACSFANDTLWPSLSGEDPRGVPSATTSAAPAPGTSGTSTVTSASTLPGAAPSASAVGRKSAELRQQLQRLEEEVAQQTHQLGNGAAYQYLDMVDERRHAGQLHSPIGARSERPAWHERSGTPPARSARARRQPRQHQRRSPGLSSQRRDRHPQSLRCRGTSPAGGACTGDYRGTACRCHRREPRDVRWGVVQPGGAR